MFPQETRVCVLQGLSQGVLQSLKELTRLQGLRTFLVVQEPGPPLVHALHVGYPPHLHADPCLPEAEDAALGGGPGDPLACLILGGARLVPVEVFKGRRGDVSVQEGRELPGQGGGQQGLSVHQVIFLKRMSLSVRRWHHGLRFALKKGRAGTLSELPKDRVLSCWQL